MPASADGVAELMRRFRFERLLALPAVPATAQTRYQRCLPLAPEGSAWYLRSPGSTFTLLHRSWVRRGIRRAYSTGWGLVDDRQVHSLLLAQAFLPTERDASALGTELSDELTLVGEQAAWTTSSCWDLPCLRLWTTLTRTT